MATTKQAAANRQNAKKSTGPKTADGKATASQNALKHGVLSASPVVKGLERPEDWEAHRDAILANLLPDGRLETVLAERVALILWRLNRVARYEPEVIAVGQESVEDDLLAERDAQPPHLREGPEQPRHPYKVQAELDDAQDKIRAFQCFFTQDDDGYLFGGDAKIVLHAVVDATSNTDECRQLVRVPGMPEFVDPEVFPAWTKSLLRTAIEEVAARDGTDAVELVECAYGHATAAVEDRLPEAREVARAVNRMRRRRLLPDTATLDKLTRYEAHLGRQLNLVLRELQRLQAMRSG